MSDNSLAVLPSGGIIKRASRSAGNTPEALTTRKPTKEAHAMATDSLPETVTQEQEERSSRLIRSNGHPWNWKGGRTVASNGYVIVRVGVDHHLADIRGYAYEHRIVAEQIIGRKLLPGEQVHHVNGDKADNRPENLEVTSGIQHHRVRHRTGIRQLRLPGEPNPDVTCQCGCGTVFRKYDSSGRPRSFVSGHNMGVRNGRSQ